MLIWEFVSSKLHASNLFKTCGSFSELKQTLKLCSVSSPSILLVVNIIAGIQYSEGSSAHLAFWIAWPSMFLAVDSVYQGFSSLSHVSKQGRRKGVGVLITRYYCLNQHTVTSSSSLPSDRSVLTIVHQKVETGGNSYSSGVSCVNVPFEGEWQKGIFGCGTDTLLMCRCQPPFLVNFRKQLKTLQVLKGLDKELLFWSVMFLYCCGFRLFLGFYIFTYWMLATPKLSMVPQLSGEIYVFWINQ